MTGVGAARPARGGGDGPTAGAVATVTTAGRGGPSRAVV
jgi:hypothetical protein